MTSLVHSPVPAREPWEDFFSFSPLERQLIDRLTGLLTRLVITSHAETKRDHLRNLKRCIQQINKFDDIYIRVALETTNVNSPLYEQSLRSAISPHHLREFLWNPSRVYIPLSIRELINWCNTAIPHLSTGMLPGHRQI
jgi:hypothetical protein